MAFTPSMNSRVLLGILHLSCTTRSFDHSSDSDMIDVTTLCDTSKQFIPGQNGSTATVEMILDSDGAANGQYDALHDMKATGPYPLTIAPVGTARNSQVILVNANEVQLTTSSTVTGSVDASLSAQTDGATDFGVSLEALAAVTADTNGTSTDNSASSANGGVAHLHVTAFSGLTSDVITIEHSTNDSVWATLGTFATVTGLTSERLVIAAGTTVNRYLRVVDNVTGTGSITRQVSFSRR